MISLFHLTSYRNRDQIVQGLPAIVDGRYILHVSIIVDPYSFNVVRAYEI